MTQMIADDEDCFIQKEYFSVNCLLVVYRDQLARAGSLPPKKEAALASNEGYSVCQ